MKKMFDKWKNFKIAGTVVILAAVAIFLFTNVRIKSAEDYRAEKSTGSLTENVSKAQDKNLAESEAGIVAENGETGRQGELESSAASEGGLNPSESATREPGASQGGTQQGGQTGAAGGDKGNPGNSVQNQSGGSSQPETETKKTIQVSIEIRCDSAVKLKDSISNPGLKEKIPDSGEILKETVYRVPEGTNVYELLSQAAGENGIIITANANKTYVMGINYLDQMMLGQQSGWKYSVNGKVPGMAASSYILQNGDKVKWFYVLSANEE